MMKEDVKTIIQFVGTAYNVCLFIVIGILLLDTIVCVGPHRTGGGVLFLFVPLSLFFGAPTFFLTMRSQAAGRMQSFKLMVNGGGLLFSVVLVGLFVLFVVGFRGPLCAK